MKCKSFYASEEDTIYAWMVDEFVVEHKMQAGDDFVTYGRNRHGKVVALRLSHASTFESEYWSEHWKKDVPTALFEAVGDVLRDLEYRKPLDVSYDKGVDVLSVKVGGAVIARSNTIVGDHFTIINYDSAGTIVGFQVLGAAALSRPQWLSLEFKVPTTLYNAVKAWYDER